MFRQFRAQIGCRFGVVNIDTPFDFARLDFAGACTSLHSEMIRQCEFNNR